MTTKREVSPEVQVLMRAKDVLERRGWGQHRAVLDDGRVCLAAAIQMGASAIQVDLMFDYSPAALHYAVESVVRAAYELLPEPVRENIPGWNDRLGRTKAEVMEALDAAIAQGMGCSILADA